MEEVLYYSTYIFRFKLLRFLEIILFQLHFSTFSFPAHNIQINLAPLFWLDSGFQNILRVGTLQTQETTLFSANGHRHDAQPAGRFMIDRFWRDA